MVGDYISRKAAMSLPFANDQYDHVHADPHFIAGCETYKEWLRTIPAADVVAVVRCRECIYWRGENDLCKGICIDFGADGYCSEGKRKDGGQDDV